MKSAFILVKEPAATEVLDVTTSSEFINARLVDYKDTKDQYERLKLEITTLPGLTLGRISETVTVKTNLTEKPTAVLRLTGSVIGDVEVTPEWMTFVVTDVASSRPSTLTKKLFISNHVDGAELEIVEINDPEGHLELTLKPLTKGQKYELTAKLKTETLPERGSVNGNVILTTNFPSQRELAIRYTAVRKAYQGKASGNTTRGRTGNPDRNRMRGIEPPLVPGEGEGIFAPTGNDPFAAGGLVDKMDTGKKTEKKETSDSRKESGTKELADANDLAEAEKATEEKKE